MSDLGLPVLVSGQEPAAFAVCTRGEKRAGVSGDEEEGGRQWGRATGATAATTGEKKNKRDASQSREKSEKAIRAFSTSSASCAKKGESRTEKGEKTRMPGYGAGKGAARERGTGTHACTRCAPRARRLRKSP